MDFLWIVVAIVAVVALIIITQKINRGKSSHCKKCKAKLSYPQDITVYAGPQQWVEKQKQNGEKYIVYYRTVGFDVKCSHCQHQYKFKKEIIVNRSDSGHSQSPAQEIDTLKRKIPLEFEKGVFEGDIKIEFIED